MYLASHRLSLPVLWDTGSLWDNGLMTGIVLVARLHVDLQRVSSAICPAA